MNTRIRPIFLVTSLLLLAGCQSQRLTPPESAGLQSKHWQKAKAYDHRRLAGWDRPPTGLWGVVVGLWHLPGQWISQASGLTPEKAVHQMYDPDSADQRRQGILFLSDRPWGRQGIYLEAYQQTALHDPDYLVRAAAVRALNRARDRTAVPTFIKAMEDASAVVRTEAAKALANIPDQRAVDVLQRHLADENEDPDVRIAAADALREFKSLEVAQVLIRQLDSRRFAVAWQSRISLWFMTGRDFAYNQAKWLEYITSPGQFQ